MRSFWSDPYLWVHLAGFAAFPLFLEGCLVGFAMGDPVFPIWLELLFVGVVGGIPILWMQWQRPFYIFSLVAVSLKPAALTDDQRRLLTLFKLPRNRVLATLASIALLLVLQKVYTIAPIAASSSLLPTSHWLGLLIAAVAFFACNLFVQVPLSVASVMLSSESTVTAVSPYPLEQIRPNFTLIGLQLNQILPPVVPPEPTIAPQSNVAKAIAETHRSEVSEPLTSDLWAEAPATSDDSITASDVLALDMDETADRSEQEIAEAVGSSEVSPPAASSSEKPLSEHPSSEQESS